MFCQNDHSVAYKTKSKTEHVFANIGQWWKFDENNFLHLLRRGFVLVLYENISCHSIKSEEVSTEMELWTEKDKHSECANISKIF